MPRKVKTKKIAKTAKRTPIRKIVAEKNYSGSFWTESYSSFLLGIVVVIVAVLFVVTIFRQQHSNVQETTSLSTSPTPTAAPLPGTTVVKGSKTYYIVKKDDSLWGIAIAMYNNGYKWTDIASSNKLANPNLIFTGDTLLIPNAPHPSELGSLIKKDTNGKTGSNNVITATSYTVQKGDTLWSIAIRAYTDGYQWTKIAQANHLANPSLIFSGNVLIIPR